MAVLGEGCGLGFPSGGTSAKTTCFDSSVMYDYCKSNGLPPHQVECYPTGQPGSVPSVCKKSPVYDSMSILCCTQSFSAGGSCVKNSDGSTSCP